MESRTGWMVGDVLVSWTLEDVTDEDRQAGQPYHALLSWEVGDRPPELGSVVPGHVTVREL